LGQAGGEGAVECVARTRGVHDPPDRMCAETAHAPAIQEETAAGALGHDWTTPVACSQVAKSLVRVGITARVHEFHRHDRVVDIGKQPPHTRPRPVEVADDGSAQITGTAHGCKRLLREVAVDQQHGLGADDREIEGRGHRFDATAVGHDEAALTAAPIHQDHSHRGGNPRTPQQSSGFDPCIS